MNQEILDKWRPAAAALKPDELLRSRVPMPVLLGEAVDVAGFLSRHWEPGPFEGVSVPGLKVVANEGRVTDSTRTEILELRNALDAAHVSYLLALDPPKVDLMRRGEQLLSEVTAWLDYLFDDDERTIEDDQLERLAREYPDPQSQDVMAAALLAYSTFANQFRDRLSAISFDVATLDQAIEVAGQLRDRSAVNDGGKGDEALDLRNRLASLLVQRVRAVRAAARLVFRAQPKLVREATSAYQRRRVASARRAASNGTDQAPSEAPLVVED